MAVSPIRNLLSVLVLVVVLLGVSCTLEPPPEVAPAAARPIGQPVEISVPLGLPPLPIPEDNPPTEDTIFLGRNLYYDTVLSVDGTIACASCHRPDAGFADPDQFSSGVGGKKGGRQAPSVINAAYYTTQFWDGRAASLEDQAGGPMQNPIEMAHTAEGVVEKLSGDPSYVAQFEKAYGPGPITFDKTVKAIASFERTVLSGNSPFDRYMYGGEESALTEYARLGLEVFRSEEKGNCATCHSMDEKSALFTDSKFHNLGVGVNDEGALTDLGRYEVTKQDEDRGAFKTPTLRNIAQSAPYMHDGSLNTLKEVVDFYIGAGNSNPWRDKDLKELDHLTRKERDALVAFMEALTADLPDSTGVPTVEK